MEFWGVEVKPGKPLKVQPEFGKLVHISQGALGEVKDVKGAKYVPLRLKIDNQTFVIGTLSAEDRPQLMFDLVFEREFEISHDCKNASVYFVGYIADDPVSDGEDFSDESDDDLMDIPEIGKAKANGDAKAVKSAAAAKHDKMKEEQPDYEESGSEDDEESDSADEMEDSEDGDESDEDADSEEEELPKPTKKRPAGSAEVTPVAAKKSKSATPDKTGNKKGQTATPFPSKAAGKAPAGNNKSEKQTPKSGGQVSCKSCSKTFTSEGALQSHSKAKHGGK